MTSRLKNIANYLFWIVMVLFVAIPTGTRYYGDRIPSFLNWLPLDLISNWGFPISLIVLGFIFGWFSKRWYDRTAAERADDIVGCLETDGILWRGVANLSRGELISQDVEPNPMCPKCKTEMKDTSPTGDPSRSSTNWVCKNPNCKHSTHTDMFLHDSAESLFSKHFERITSDEGEPYSLDALVGEIDGEVTGEKIWREYEDRVSDEEVSVDCFN
jgi:hypothetical protein